MQFIYMDLIGPFDPSSDGHKYALTVICILTGYTFCIPLKTKMVTKVVQPYVGEVYAKFWGFSKILSENGTEFKNQLFTNVGTQLELELKSTYLLITHNQTGDLKGFVTFWMHECQKMYHSFSIGIR